MKLPNNKLGQKARSEILKKVEPWAFQLNLARKFAVAALFLFMFYFGFNVAGLMKNISHRGAFVSPLFTMTREESKPIGLLKKMYQTTDSAYQPSQINLFIGRETLPLTR